MKKEKKKQFLYANIISLILLIVGYFLFIDELPLVLLLVLWAVLALKLNWYVYMYDFSFNKKMKKEKIAVYIALVVNSLLLAILLHSLFLIYSVDCSLVEECIPRSLGSSSPIHILLLTIIISVFSSLVYLKSGEKSVSSYGMAILGIANVLFFNIVKTITTLSRSYLDRSFISSAILNITFEILVIGIVLYGLYRFKKSYLAGIFIAYFGFMLARSIFLVVTRFGFSGDHTFIFIIFVVGLLFSIHALKQLKSKNVKRKK